MKIGFVGDSHGKWNDLKKAVLLLKDTVDQIIVVGDFGFWRWAMVEYDIDFPIGFIDGNHEDFAYLMSEVEFDNCTRQKIKDINLTYYPRGTVITVDNTNIGFLGGGRSIDKSFRIRHEENTGVKTWFEEEAITFEQIERFKGKHVDLFVTHDMPSSALPYFNLAGRTLKVYDPLDLQSRQTLQKLFNQNKPRFWVHGHYHAHYTAPDLDGCHIIGLGMAPDCIVFDTEAKRFCRC